MKMTAMHANSHARYFFLHVASSIAQNLHKKLVETAFGAQLEFLLNENPDSFVNRFGSDLSQATNEAPRNTLPSVFR